MLHEATSTALGKATAYKFEYDAQLLYPIARRLNREDLGILDTALPFHGVDYWTSYEISWLDLRGKPCVRIADISVDCTSTYLIESKSLKLYLNSFNHTKFENEASVKTILERDLTTALHTQVKVELNTVNAKVINLNVGLAGTCIDDIDIHTDVYKVQPAFLKAQGPVLREQLYSHLLGSICPVTAQPDWATVLIDYQGPQLDKAGLLKYIISFRSHAEFHEACVERIFMHIMEYCQPECLTVYARYTRRGGIDINPFRSNFAAAPGNQRLIRQ